MGIEVQEMRAGFEIADWKGNEVVPMFENFQRRWFKTPPKFNLIKNNDN